MMIELIFEIIDQKYCLWRLTISAANEAFDILYLFRIPSSLLSNSPYLVRLSCFSWLSFSRSFFIDSSKLHYGYFLGL